MSGVTGDIRALERFARRALSMTGISRRVADLSAPQLSAEAAQSFGAHESPYGVAWSANKDGSTRQLNDSGALKAGATSLTASGSKMKGTLPHYARYQNPRQFLPASGNPPEGWAAIVRSNAEKAIEQELST